MALLPSIRRRSGIRLLLLTACLVALFAGQSSHIGAAGLSQGSATIPRTYLDSSPGQMYIYGGGTFDANTKVSDITWYVQAAGNGHRLTPILFEKTSPSVFAVRAVGTTRVAVAGLNTAPFGLVYGSDVITNGNFTWGFVNSTVADGGAQSDATTGAVDFDYSLGGAAVGGSGTTNTWYFTPSTFGPSAVLSLGFTFGIGGGGSALLYASETRAYSAYMTVAPNAPPTLSAAPRSVELWARAGAASPFHVPVSLTSTGAFTASANQSWIAATPASGAGGASTVTIGADAFGLAPGTYTGVVTLSAAGVSPVAVGVTLHVANQQVALQDSSTTLATQNALAIASADFNHDGRPDFAVTNQATSDSPQRIQIFMSNSAGGFDSQIIPTDGEGMHLTTGDFNGDGWPDIVAAAWGQASVDVLMNDTAGGFTRTVVPLPDGVFSWNVAVGDIDGDGRQDIAVATLFGSSLYWLRGTGDGFAPAAVVGTCQGGQDVTIGDFNGDGRADVAGRCEDEHHIRVYLGNASGGFTEASASPLDSTGLDGVTAADLDGDGRQDLVAGGSYLPAKVFFGDATTGVRAGTGAFPAGRAYVGDVDGDGYPDLVFRYSGSAVLYAGSAAGTFIERGWFGSNFSVEGIVVADFDGDGANDIVGAGGNAVRAIVSGAVETTSSLAPPAHAVFGSPFAFTLTVTAGGAGGAIVPQGTAQVFLCDASFACETPASPAVTGEGTFVLPVNLALARGYYYFKARFTPGNGRTLASDTNALGLPVEQAQSTLTLNPVSQPLSGGVPFTMTATITPARASGAVNFYDAAHGTLLATATLVDGVATATIPGLPAHSFWTIQAEYATTTDALGSASDYVDLSIGAAPQLSLIGLDEVWTGVPNPVTVNNPGNIPITVTYNGSTTVPVDLGDYTVEARSTDPNRPASVTGTLHIRVNTNVTLDVPALTVTYDGQPHSTTVTTDPAGLHTVVKFRDLATNLDSTTAPVEPGDYFELADVVDPRGTQLYQGVGVISITKKVATVTLSNLDQTFDGTNTGPTVTTTPAGLATTITYNGLPNTQGLGSYTVVATVQDPHWQGTATGTYVIRPPAFTITNTDQTFDGTPRAVTVTPNAPGTPYVVTYNGSATTPVAVGTYAVMVTSTDPGHPGSATGTLIVRKGTGGFTVSNTSQPYTGAPRPITVTTTPAGLQYTVLYGGSAVAPTAPGSYAFTVTITDANVNAVAPQSGTLTITKGTATVTIDNLTQGDTGQAHRVTVTTSPAGLATTVTYNGSPNPPTTAGDYTVVATITDANYAGTATATLSVVPRAVTTMSAQYNTVYLFRADPQVQPQQIPYGAATITLQVTGGSTPATGRLQMLDSFNNGPLAVIYDSQTAVTPPASFTVTLPIGTHRLIAGYQGDDLHQPANFVSDIKVVRATANITPNFSQLTQTFNGQPRGVDFTVSPAGAQYTVTYAGSATPPSDAGTYKVVVRVNDPNVENTSASYTLTINRMTATVTLGALTQVADGDPKSPTAIANPALPPGYQMEFTYDGKKNAPSKIGSYAVVASNPNITGTASGTFTLVAPLTIAGGTFTYDGTPKAATVTFTDPLTRIKSVVYSNATYTSETPPTDAGTYTATATGCGGGNGCNNTATATIVINKAQVGLGFASLTNPTTGKPVPVSVNYSPSSIPNVPVTVTYDGSTTAPTTAGAYTVVASVNSPNFIAQPLTATYFVVPGQTIMTLASRVVDWNASPQSLTATISPSNAPYTLSFEQTGRFPSATPPTDAGVYTVTMTATGGYSGQVTATLEIRGFLRLSSNDSSRPFTFTLDGRRMAADTVSAVSAGPHIVTADGKQVSALERYSFGSWRNDYSGVSLGTLPDVMPAQVTSLGGGFLVAVPKSEYAVITSVVEGNGTVTGDGWYAGTSRVPLVATPAPGYLFERFTIDGQDITENGYTLSMAGAGHRVKAHFVQASTVTTRVSPAGSGFVTGAGIFPINALVSLSANPAQGFRFSHWEVSGGVIPGANLNAYATPVTVKASTTDVVVTAVFEPVVAIAFTKARWVPGLMYADMTITNTSSIPVQGLQLTSVTDDSKLLKLADGGGWLPLNIGTLAPGQSVTVQVMWIILADLPPSSFSFTVTVRSAEGYVYTKATSVSNY